MTVTITMTQQDVFEACAEWLRARGANISTDDVNELFTARMKMDGQVQVTMTSDDAPNVGGPYR
jgi:hypothetical protein